MASLAEFVRDLQRTLGWRIWLLAAMTLLCAIAEGLTIATLLPLFALLGLGSSERGGTVASVLKGLLDGVGLPLTMTSIGILLAGMMAVSAVLFLVQAKLAVTLQARYMAAWQTRLANALLQARWTYLRETRGGDLASSIAVEAPRIGSTFYQANLILTSAVFIAAQCLVALLVAPTVTLGLVALGALLFAVTRVLAVQAAEDGRILSKANAELLGRVGEMFRALKLIKATSTEKTALGRISPVIRDIEAASARSAFDIQVARAVFEYGGGAAIALLLIFGPTLLGADVAQIIVVVAIFVRLFPKITALRQCLQTIALVLPSFETALRVEHAALGAADPGLRRDGIAPPDTGPAAVTFDGVTLTLPDGSPVLDRIDLAIAPGSFVAIAGPSGAGKTTFADLVLGLVEPSGGTVRIDGADLSRLDLAAWRSRIGYIGQDPILFSGTIAENIRWGRPDLTDEQMKAAMAATAADLIRAGRGSADLHVGEAGVLLSGGERQRLALARAVAADARLLVLDEATSALDPEMEAVVTATLADLRGRTTILAIAHRLWSVRGADRVIVLESGRVIQDGSFDDLAQADGWFRDMLARQSGPRGATAADA